MTHAVDVFQICAVHCYELVVSVCLFALNCKLKGNRFKYYYFSRLLEIIMLTVMIGRVGLTFADNTLNANRRSASFVLMLLQYTC